MLAELVAPLLAALPPGHNLVGVGAAAAGLVRRADGFLSVSPNRGWRDAPLGEMIAQFARRQSRAGRQRSRRQRARRVSARRGPPRRARHLRCRARVGLGLGVIHDGQPMLGAAGYAGEAGHTVINPDGRHADAVRPGAGRPKSARRPSPGGQESHGRVSRQELDRRVAAPRPRRRPSRVRDVPRGRALARSRRREPDQHLQPRADRVRWLLLLAVPVPRTAGGRGSQTASRSLRPGRTAGSAAASSASTPA